MKRESTKRLRRESGRKRKRRSRDSRSRKGGKKRKKQNLTECSQTRSRWLSSRWPLLEASSSNTEANSKAGNCSIGRPSTGSRRLTSTLNVTTKDLLSVSFPILSTALLVASPRPTGINLAPGRVTVKHFCSHLIETRSISKTKHRILLMLTAATDRFSE